ncbi:MAG: DUF4416 family protein, partial [Syntrophorhabdaceae bacterium]|nr:DUF4416 family protein [Syntrophorhabdaceae bacterium]
MGDIKQPKPVALFASIIYKNNETLKGVFNILEKKIDQIEEKSDVMPFNHTDYYEEEMGSELHRIFILFKSLMPRESLVSIKLTTNNIEKELSIQ